MKKTNIKNNESVFYGFDKEELLKEYKKIRKELSSGTTYTYHKKYDVLRVNFDDSTVIELLDFSDKFKELEEIYKQEIL